MVPRRRRVRPVAAAALPLTVLGALALPPATAAQVADNPDMRVERIEIRPAAVQVAVGQRARLEIVALDSAGRPVPDAFLRAFSDGAAVSFDPTTNEVEGTRPGRSRVSASIRRPVTSGPGFETLSASATVTVRPRPVSRVEFADPPARVYAGTRLRLRARAWSEAAPRDDVELSFRSSDPSVLEVGVGGTVHALRPGAARLTAGAEGVETTIEIRAVENPVRELRLERREVTTRVGDVFRVRAVPVDGAGVEVGDAPVEWSWAALSDEPFDAMWLELEPPGTAVAVAHEPGSYRLTARVGSLRAEAKVRAAARPPRRQIRLVAHGTVPTGQATTDLWVFEGLDGRAYCYTGTFSGHLMYAWEVTDPGNPVITDSVAFDGRRVNDVKINAARTLAVVTSENAANRRNGITVLDISDPAHPRRLAHYTEGLTGGVHNTWIVDDLVYAIHYGTRDVHIIDISDPAQPREVGRWGLPKEDKFLHDVTVRDGLAYLSYWDDGVVILDVGAGVAGGTPTEPKLVSSYAYAYRLGDEWYGNTHHAIRYGDYVFTGDEIFGCSECVNGARGYVHVIDVSDIRSPREVAWYRVPEAGSHNLWAEDGKLYIGYYGGGLRVVDISGELRGDLYRQGREIGWFMTEDSGGTVPNATSTWGAQPFKGKIFASDGNSGLWIVEMEPEPLVP